MKTQISKQQAQKWANALRSGEYRQGKFALERWRMNCCLGVACRLFIPKSKITLINGWMDGALPDDQPSAPKWLIEVDHHFRIKTGSHLSFLNDQEGFTFDMIADMIELVYVHKMLG